MKLSELIYLLKTAQTVEDIDRYRDEIATLIPQIKIMFGYDQHNHAHQYDLWTHTLHTVINLPRDVDDDMMYFAALLHDIGKPDCRCDGKRPDDTSWHYYGHPERGHEIVRDEILSYIELSDDEKRILLYYVLHHDDHISLRIKHLKRHLKEISLEEFKHLMLIEVADAKAHIMEPIIQQRVDICSQWSGEYADEMYEKIGVSL